ncbi:MAG: hypothetical protein AB7K35_07895 [Pseudorhodoplanes sp.]
MSRETKTRFAIAALIYSMTNAVLFGVGLIVILLVPAFGEHLAIAMLAVVASSFLLAAPIAWFLAPRLRARYWRRRGVLMDGRPAWSA